MIISGTGHRPPKLGLPYAADAFEFLARFVTEQLARLQREGVFPGEELSIVSGMAQGFDQALATAAVNLGIPFEAVLPFHGMDERWPEYARQLFARLIDKASNVAVLRQRYSNSAYFARDRWMVDRGNHLLALWDPEEQQGGTTITVTYARAQGRPMTNLWDAWIEFRGQYKKSDHEP